MYLPPVICFTYKMHYVDVKDKGEDEIWSFCSQNFI